jgi:hypothetical protein
MPSQLPGRIGSGAEDDVMGMRKSEKMKYRKKKQEERR